MYIVIFFINSLQMQVKLQYTFNIKGQENDNICVM